MTSLLGEPGGGSLLGEPGGCDWYIGLRFNVPEINNITLFCGQKTYFKMVFEANIWRRQAQRQKEYEILSDDDTSNKLSAILIDLH